jgi:hypothetical protein
VLITAGKADDSKAGGGGGRNYFLNQRWRRRRRYRQERGQKQSRILQDNGVSVSKSKQFKPLPPRAQICLPTAYNLKFYILTISTNLNVAIIRKSNAVHYKIQKEKKNTSVKKYPFG